MKNTLMLPIVFLAYLGLWIGVLALFSVLGNVLQMQLLLEGRYAFFLGEIIYQGLQLFPAASLVATATLFLYIMRHRVLVSVSIVLFVLFSTALVFWAIPASFTLLSEYAPARAELINSARIYSEKLPSSGVIHHSLGNRWIWFSDTPAGDLNSLAVVRNEKTAGDEVFSVYQTAAYVPGTRTILPDGEANPMHALVVDKSSFGGLRQPPFISALLSDVHLMSQTFYRLWYEDAYAYWLQTGVCFFFILSLFACTLWSSWRLLNAVCLFAVLRAFFILWRVVVYERKVNFFEEAVGNYLPEAYMYPLFLAVFALALHAVGIVFAVRRGVTSASERPLYD